jgi:hypothetical protein
VAQRYATDKARYVVYQSWMTFAHTAMQNLPIDSMFENFLSALVQRVDVKLRDRSRIGHALCPGTLGAGVSLCMKPDDDWNMFQGLKRVVIDLSAK